MATLPAASLVTVGWVLSTIQWTRNCVVSLRSRGRFSTGDALSSPSPPFAEDGRCCGPTVRVTLPPGVTPINLRNHVTNPCRTRCRVWSNLPPSVILFYSYLMRPATCNLKPFRRTLNCWSSYFPETDFYLPE